jgi:acyl-CoA synthetase (AMP-forming)/AMP-acid ligase II/acyl carrier protein
MNGIVNQLNHWAEQAPQKKAFIYVPNDGQKDNGLSFSELREQAMQLACRLRANHKPQSRVLILLPQNLDYVVAVMGCFYAGMVAVPAFLPRRSRNMERHEAITIDCGAELIIGDSALQAQIATSKHAQLRSCTWVTPTPEAENATTVLEARGVPSLTDLAFLQYTSGSTGQPKGVMVTHGNLAANATLSKKEFGFRIEDIMGGWLPFYHDMGLVGHLLQSAYNGMTSVFMEPAAFVKRPLSWLEMLSRYKATITGAPNFALELCADRVSPEEVKNLNLSSIRILYSGAEKVQKTTLDRFTAHFAASGFVPSVFQPCYGLAEGTLMVTTRKKAPDALPVERDVPVSLNPGAVVPQTPEAPVIPLIGNGQVPESSAVIVVHPEDLQTLPESCVGEVWIKGSSVAQGYLNQPGLSAQVFQATTAEGDQPYLRTGDLGFLENQELFIVGRIKETLIIRGQNYDPVDLEKAACSTEKSLNRDAAVAFTLDGSGTEALMLALEVKRSFWRKLNHEQIVESVRARLASEFDLNATGILIVKPHGIPKTTSGKLQRFKCKALFEAGELPVLYEWKAPAAQPKPVEPPAPSTAADQPAQQLRNFLTAEVSRRLNMPADDISGHTPLTDYGLDSMNAMELVGEIEAKFDIQLDPTLLWEVPTIDELVEFCEIHYFGNDA